MPTTSQCDWGWSRATASSCVTTWRSRVTLSRCLPSTRNTSTWLNRFPSAWTGFREALSRCKRRLHSLLRVYSMGLLDVVVPFLLCPRFTNLYRGTFPTACCENIATATALYLPELTVELSI